MRDTERLVAPTVWVMQPSGSEAAGWWFPWSWRLWQHEPALVLEDDTRTASSLGMASFRLLRQTRMDPLAPPKLRGRYQKYSNLVIPGAYVCVVKGTGVLDRADANWPIDPTQVLWWGTLGPIHKDPIRGSDEYSGAVDAYEIGRILDSQRVRSPWVKSPTTSYPLYQLGEGPTANLEGKGGQVVGNAIVGKVSAADPTDVFLYAPTAAECGTAEHQIWTRWRLLHHICTLAPSFGLPRIDLADGGAGWNPSPDASTVPGYLNLTDFPEVLDPWKASYRGAFDLLAPESHSLQWRVELNPNHLDRWLLRIRSTNSEAGYSMPVGAAVDLTLTRDESLKITDARADMPDEVAVQGQRCRFMATAAAADGNLGGGWSAAIETAYEAAKQEDRSQPRFQDCFVRYVLVCDSQARLRVKPDPGTGAGIGIPFCPLIIWDGSAVTLSTAKDYTPYFPATQLVATLPWPIGLKGDGTDQRDTDDLAAPSYIKPKVFYVDAGVWYDLTAKNTAVGEVPSVSLDDRGPALRIEYTIQHLLGAGTFSSSDLGGEAGTLDYRKLAATVAIDSAQSVYVARGRPGVVIGTTTQFSRLRTRLLVEDHRLQFTAALKGTALGIVKNTTNTVDRVTVTNEPGGLGYILRNDFGVAQRYCDRLAAYAFRARQAAEISLVRPDDPPAWAEPGIILGVVTDIAQPWELYTAVRTVRRAWTGGKARLSITTDLPTMPSAPGMVVSPTGGGPVSPTLGGTVPQAVAALAQSVRALEGGTQRQVVIPPRLTDPSPASFMFQIIGGNSLPYLPGSVGVKKVTTTIAAIPAGYANGSPSTLMDGVGWARSMDNDRYCLVVHDALSLVSHDLLMGTPVYAVQIGEIADDAGGTYQVYRITGAI